MLYILLEIWFWVAAAALVGAIFGWWLRSIRAGRQVAREALLWQRRIQQLKRLAEDLKQTTEGEGRRERSDDAGS